MNADISVRHKVLERVGICQGHFAATVHMFFGFSAPCPVHQLMDVDVNYPLSL